MACAKGRPHIRCGPEIIDGIAIGFQLFERQAIWSVLFWSDQAPSRVRPLSFEGLCCAAIFLNAFGADKPRDHQKRQAIICIGKGLPGKFLEINPGPVHDISGSRSRDSSERCQVRPVIFVVKYDAVGAGECNPIKGVHNQSYCSVLQFCALQIHTAKACKHGHNAGNFCKPGSDRSINGWLHRISQNDIRAYAPK